MPLMLIAFQTGSSIQYAKDKLIQPSSIIIQIKLKDKKINRVYKVNEVQG